MCSSNKSGPLFFFMEPLQNKQNPIPAQSRIRCNQPLKGKRSINRDY